LTRGSIITRGIRRLRRASRWSTVSSGPKALILLYHRVAELRLDPWSLGVTPQHFDEHLEVLREQARPLHLRQLTQALLENNLPDRSVVVTFDDGYADNLYNAKPALERYGIPATFFLISGYAGHSREFWWDELDRLLLQPGTLPETLRLDLDGNTHEWQLGEAAHYSEDDFWHHRNWRGWVEAPSPRHRFYLSLWEMLNLATESERRRLLDELQAWAAAEPAVHSTHRSLSLEEVMVLAEGPLVEIGAHTVTHPHLPSISVESQRDEIQRSKARLEDILGDSVRSFSYPHGSLSAETIAIVRAVGFDCACSSLKAAVKSSTDRLQLPRRSVENLTGKTFAKQLSEWFRR